MAVRGMAGADGTGTKPPDPVTGTGAGSATGVKAGASMGAGAGRGVAGGSSATVLRPITGSDIPAGTRPPGTNDARALPSPAKTGIRSLGGTATGAPAVRSDWADCAGVCGGGCCCALSLLALARDLAIVPAAITGIAAATQPESAGSSAHSTASCNLRMRCERRSATKRSAAMPPCTVKPARVRARCGIRSSCHMARPRSCAGHRRRASGWLPGLGCRRGQSPQPRQCTPCRRWRRAR